MMDSSKLPIRHFINSYRFLSNFYEKELFYLENGKFKSAEHAYQSTKARHFHDFEMIKMAETPEKAKCLGKKVELRKDWPFIRTQVMLNIIRRKFKDKDLREQLLNTGDADLIEGNKWHDNFWGVCLCHACRNLYPGPQNNLGKILMLVRDEAREEEEWLKDAEPDATGFPH